MWHQVRGAYDGEVMGSDRDWRADEESDEAVVEAMRKMRRETGRAATRDGSARMDGEEVGGCAKRGALDTWAVVGNTEGLVRDTGRAAGIDRVDKAAGCDAGFAADEDTLDWGW